eukprot:scaffold25862_cov70-Skeletonema_dohrnii-CCMP3373.AAC.1
MVLRLLQGAASGCNRGTANKINNSSHLEYRANLPAPPPRLYLSNASRGSAKAVPDLRWNT